jgi:hypothetical protein
MEGRTRFPAQFQLASQCCTNAATVLLIASLILPLSLSIVVSLYKYPKFRARMDLNPCWSLLQIAFPSNGFSHSSARIEEGAGKKVERATVRKGLERVR